MTTKELRALALRKLIGQQQLKDFANAHDLDSSYLSQILNGHRAMGEKAAEKMAAKIGVDAKILVSPGMGDDTNGAVVDRDAAYQNDKLYQEATPEHRQAVDDLAHTLLGLSPEQALKVKQAMELLIPANDRYKT